MNKPVPKGAWMTTRSRGRTIYAQNQTPIVWGSKPPPPGIPIHVIAWTRWQNNFMSKRIIIL